MRIWTSGRPLAGAGIEIVKNGERFGTDAVRPLAGAGIEIRIFAKSKIRSRVRPLAGAGIEILRSGSQFP